MADMSDTSVTLHPTVMASGPLTYLMGCGVPSYNSYQVCYLQKRVVFTEATGYIVLAQSSGNTV